MTFAQEWEEIQMRVHRTARDKGWWTDGEKRNDAECIALMHSELSEALEALREGNPSDEKCPEFSALEVELADVVIRIMDYAEPNCLDIAGAILAKINFNQGRPHKHGGKNF